MLELNPIAQQEVLLGNAIPLEEALQYIIDAVEEVVSVKITQVKSVNDAAAWQSSILSMIYFHCRLHNPLSVPLNQFCFMPGIVSREKVTDTILLLRAYTGETIRLKL